MIVPYYPQRSVRSKNVDLLIVSKIFKISLGGRVFSWQQLPVQVLGLTPSLCLRVGNAPFR